MHTARLKLCVFSGLLLLGLCSPATAQRGEFLKPETFAQQAFKDPASALQVLWLNKDLRRKAESILGHSYSGLRQRYWGDGTRTAWIFEEIGKELPITIGVVVENNRVHQVRILAYRESRGGEVRYPFFTRQFEQLSLIGSPEDYGLSGHIDGITGATLSVRAVSKVATLALFFHQQTPHTEIAHVAQ